MSPEPPVCPEDPYGLLAQRHNCPCSSRYKRVLGKLMTPLQARVVAELPSPPGEIAPKLGISEEEVKAELDDLFQRGVISVRDIARRQGYRFWGDVGLLFTYTLALAELKGINGGLVESWRDFIQEEWHKKLVEEYTQRPQPFDRVLPALKSVEDPSQLLPCEDVRQLMRAQELIAIHPCACRVGAGQCQTPRDNCFLFGWAAEYALARDAAQRLSVEEALKVIDGAASHGLVHIWMNTSFMQARYMCNCCRCCCVILHPPQRFGLPMEKRLAKSRFEAVVVEPGRCYTCPDHPCLSPCQFDAIALTPTPPGQAVIDPEKCWGCGFCVVKCPYEALTMRPVRPPEHIPGAVSTL